MIDLFGHDQYSVLGVASILELEKIPYHRVGRIEPFGEHLLIAAGDSLSISEVRALEERTALVLNGGVLFAREAFGASDATIVDTPCSISLSQSIWPPTASETARSFGKSTLRIPRTPICRTAKAPPGSTRAILSLATTAGRQVQPAVRQRSGCLWCLIDLGAAFANLITENYLPINGKQQAKRSSFSSLTSRAPQAIYYAAPGFLRGWVQGWCYSRVEQRLNTYREQVSEYPIDATGWLLVELVKTLVKLAAGFLVTLARWPAPHRSAAAITHDIEPTQYAYTRGLKRLLNRVATSGHPATIGLVAGDSIKHLKNGLKTQLYSHDVSCHGLEHRGETTGRQRSQVAATVQIARARLEHKLSRPINGYRSPRLDRSEALAWALDRTGFRHDSSYPDVDRENLEHFGAGVRVTFPYRPFVQNESGKARFSNCLELPLTAPDCIQPIFTGATVETLRKAVKEKASFVRTTGGLYVALIHAGVFGEQDSAIREAHLEFVCGQLRHPEVWLASMREITDWWLAREAVKISIDTHEVTITNTGSDPTSGLRLILEDKASRTVLPVPTLKPASAMVVDLPAQP